MNKRGILKIILIIYFVSLGVVIPKKVDGYVCPSGYYCETAGGVYGPGLWLRKTNGDCYYLNWRRSYDCSGTDNNCSGRSSTYYYSVGDCLNDTNSHFAGCCNAISDSPPCTPRTSCNCSPLSSSSTSYGSKTITCSDGCDGTTSRECWCTNNCTPQSCLSGTSESGTHGTYATYTCTNECNKSNSRTCKCISACTPTSCPTGTTETNTGDYYSSYSCTNMCNESQTKNCYCSICTPPSCLNSGYSDTNLGYGQVPLEKAPSCRNGYNAPNYISKCDMTYRTCYCSSCLKQCPSPLANTGSANLILNDFRECTNDCSVKPPEDQDDCYEVSSEQPTESLEIINTNATNHYGFNSGTHTGDRQVETARLGTLNDPFNPPITMVATYTDANGASDIEGIFVWFKGEQYTGELATPILLSETAEPKASANNSWGFMLKRSGSNWLPYVPSYNKGNVFWTSKDTSGKVFSIDGPNGGKMVEVTISNITEIDNTTVSMEFSLRFSNNNGDLFSDNVSEGLYKIYLMGLDKFSFTPYDNYDMDINYQEFWSKGFKYYGYTTLLPFWQPGQLRYKPEQGQTYARSWTDTGKTWTIDRTAPTLNTNVTVSGNSITLSWDASDDRNLYAIVGNIFTSGDDVKTITVSTQTIGVSLHDPATFSLNSENNGVDENKIGILNNMDVSLFQVDSNIDGTEHSGSVTLNINHEAQNSLYFFITVFDDAGNIAQSEEIKQDLNDWMVTSGGLAYSNGGTSFTVKDLAEGTWSGILPPSSYESNPGLIPPDVNFTSEMWGQMDRLINFIPESPLNSYSLIFKGIKLVEENSYYTLLLDLYERNKKNLGNSIQEIIDVMTFSTAVSNYCLNEYCVFKYDDNSNVVIEQGFACNKKTLMFINGNLTIKPPLKNSTGTDTLSNKNGCIFVVSGNVYIKEGSNASNSGFGYDKVNGYILADGQIIIDDESYKRDHNTDPIIDGVYVNGGLQSSKSNDDKSILFNRYLRLEDRLKFPLLAIDLHPKYGVLGEEFFGSKYIIQTVELGVKP